MGSVWVPVPSFPDSLGQREILGATASMSDQTASSLAFLWTRRRRIRRLLFFTYRFNFRWFHNEVLGVVRRNSLADTDVLVFATRFDDDDYVGGTQSSGDLYSLDEWAKWRVNLRIRYLPANQHLFHNKFIIGEYEKSGLRGAPAFF